MNKKYQTQFLLQKTKGIRETRKNKAYSLADSFGRKVHNLLVHGPFLIALHYSFLKVHIKKLYYYMWRDIQLIYMQHNLTKWITSMKTQTILHTQTHTLKYIGAMSPNSRGSGIHSKTMCCLLRGFMCVSKNTQSSSWDSNIRTKVLRNSWGQQRSEIKF